MSSDEEDIDSIDEEEEVAEKPKRRRKKKAKKDPNRPKRNMSAFFLYSNANRERVKAENPESKFGDIVSGGGSCACALAVTTRLASGCCLCRCRLRLLASCLSKIGHRQRARLLLSGWSVTCSVILFPRQLLSVRSRPVINDPSRHLVFSHTS